MNEQRERAELETVLASTLFARAPDLSKILKYVCEKHFSNRGESIKEYSIAVEALGRRPDFRPDVDSIVRVQAARLRKHLRKYYETDGAGHPLEIRISPTGYKPEFVPVRTPEALAADNAPVAAPLSSESPPVRSRKLARWATLALGVALVGTGTWVGYRSSSTPVKPPSAPMPAASPVLSIRAGFSNPTFLDVTGGTWLGDRYFTGGEPFERTGGPILRTFDQALYQTGRRGDFSYAIPLKPGIYELHLHFNESFFGPTVGAETLRTFGITINGREVLTAFDIAKDAGGPNIADEKVFTGISPGADGFLRLMFTSRRDRAILNGIEIMAGDPGGMLPTRIVCSPHSYIDKQGRYWKADAYFSGGRISERIDLIEDPTFGHFSSYRTGNFNYAIPVADGSYTANMKFAEPVIGRDVAGGVGRRVFDVYCNGRTLLEHFDVFRETGGAYRVIDKTFSHLKPDAQGKLIFSFVPVKSYAVLLAIEVLQEKD